MHENDQMDRPRVVLLSTASVDGRLAVSPERLLLMGDERWSAIAEGGAFDLFRWLRSHHRAQATLEGSGSFVREAAVPGALPTVSGDPQGLYQDFLPPQILQRPERQGWFCAVDGRGRVRWVYKDGYPDPLWQGWHLLVWTCGGTPPGYLAYLQESGIPYLMAGETDQVDLGLALGKIKQKLGVSCLLSTAGGRLNGALLRAGLVDEVNIEFLPALIGGRRTPTLFEAADLTEEQEPTRLRLIWSQTQGDGRLWARYAVEYQQQPQG